MGTVLNTAELLSARNVKSAELKELGGRRNLHSAWRGRACA